MSSDQQRGPRPNTNSGRQSAIGVSLLLIAIAGVLAYAYSGFKTVEEIDATYGKRRGYLGARSVNGTAVLAGMFERKGSRVSSWDRLSPRLMNADTIVWTPNNLKAPPNKQRQWFDQWLQSGPNRTLIYVGRDYFGDVEYWTDIQPLAPNDQKDEVSRRLSKARGKRKATQVGLGQIEDAGWFTIRRGQSSVRVSSLGGRWSAGVDAAKSDIVLDERLVVPTYADHEVLLDTRRIGWFADEAEPIVAKRFDLTWGQDSSFIVVTNGSFLLNYPLINHEHRKLASKLIAECGNPQDVVFLESGELGPPIVAKDPDRRRPGALELAKVWPLSAIIPHVVACGVVLCFALYPVFGRPRRVARKTQSDFSKHIDALGKLLIETQDRAYAQERINHYQGRAKRDSGASHSHVKSASGMSETASPATPQPFQPRETGTLHFSLSYPASPPFAKIHAEAAVKTARSHFDVVLDYSPQSLTQVDQILLRYHQQRLTVEQIGAVIFGFGCYAGQIMVQQFDGTWKEPGETALGSGAGPYMVVELSNNSLWNPIGKAFKLVENGAADSLAAFYQLVTQI